MRLAKENRARGFLRRNQGNVMIMGVVVITLLSMFGVVLVSRMVVDAHSAARRVVSTKAFYAADAGIQWGRRYLWLGNTSSTTLGPSTLGDASVTVQVQRTQAYWQGSSFWDREDIYLITSTATIGDVTRQVEELRWRGGGSDKQFMMWREVVADEF